MTLEADIRTSGTRVPHKSTFLRRCGNPTVGIGKVPYSMWAQSQTYTIVSSIVYLIVSKRARSDFIRSRLGNENRNLPFPN